LLFLDSDSAFVSSLALGAAFDKNGEYTRSPGWGPEGEIYKAMSSIALVGAYQRYGLSDFRRSSQDLIERFLRNRLPTGGWGLRLTAPGSRFTVTDSERTISYVTADLTVIGAILKAAIICDSVDVEGAKELVSIATTDLVAILQSVVTAEAADQIQGLRSNPDAYLCYVYGALQMVLDNSEYCDTTKVDVVSQCITELEVRVDAFIATLSPESMPLMFAYWFTHLKKRKLSYDMTRISESLRYSFQDKNLYDFLWHLDGRRGYSSKELHLRSAIGYLVADNVDKTRGGVGFLSEDLAVRLRHWVIGLRQSDGTFFEFIDCTTNNMMGCGNPGLYLPLLAEFDLF